MHCAIIQYMIVHYGIIGNFALDFDISVNSNSIYSIQCAHINSSFICKKKYIYLFVFMRSVVL